MGVCGGGSSSREEKPACYGNFNWGHLGLAAACGFLSGFILAIIIIL